MDQCGDPVPGFPIVKCIYGTFWDTPVVFHPLGHGGAEWSPSTYDPQTGFTYAATDQSGICCDPLLAHVFAGTTSTLPTPAVQFVTGNDNIFYRWDNLTIAAGQTVIVMHFAVQHDPADLAGTKAQADSLATLTDPNALTGMSAADKAAVANFVIP